MLIPKRPRYSISRSPFVCSFSSSTLSLSSSSCSPPLRLRIFFDLFTFFSAVDIASVSVKLWTFLLLLRALDIALTSVFVLFICIVSSRRVGSRICMRMYV